MSHLPEAQITKISKGSFMRQNFKWYGRICAVSGMPFAIGLQRSDEEDVNAAMKGCYFIYSVACIFLFAFTQALYFCRIHLVIFDEVQMFTISLRFLMFSSIVLKIFFCMLTTIMRSRHLLGLFRESANYEKEAMFVPPKRRDRTVVRCVVRFPLAVAFVANVCVCSYLLWQYVDSLVSSKALAIFVKSMCFVGEFLFCVHDMAHSLIIRPCSEVFRLYIAHQHAVLRSTLGPSVVEANFTGRAARVRKIRLNLYKIISLKGRLEDILGWYVVASGFTFMFYVCVAVYILFVEEVSAPQHLPFMIYTVASCLDLLDVSDLSHGMIIELRKLRQTLRRIPICCENEAYFNEVVYLRDSINPKEISFSGAGFFKLDRPLIVSIAGAIITYTVILVQTSQSVHGGLPAP